MTILNFFETPEMMSKDWQQIPHEFNVATIEVQGKPEPRKFWQQWQPEKTKIIIHRDAKRDWQYVEPLAEGLTLELVRIPTGHFVMGAPKAELNAYSDERPQHEVHVSGFYMGKCPVTQAQWRFVATLPEVTRSLPADPSRFKGDDLPVEQISWRDVIEFCARLSEYTGREYRLPSEAEWEYACRAGTTTPFHFGETIDAEIANYCAQDKKIAGHAPSGRSVSAGYPSTTFSGRYGGGQLGEYRGQTTPVGWFNLANQFGLYDMHGNVWEWCLDHWHENYQGAPVDGSAWIDSEASESAKRLLRGGSWSAFPQNCRSACRFNYPADSGHREPFGFRVVCSMRTPT